MSTEKIGLAEEAKPQPDVMSKIDQLRRQLQEEQEKLKPEQLAERDVVYELTTKIRDLERGGDPYTVHRKLFMLAKGKCLFCTYNARLVLGFPPYHPLAPSLTQEQYRLIRANLDQHVQIVSAAELASENRTGDHTCWNVKMTHVIKEAKDPERIVEFDGLKELTLAERDSIEAYNKKIEEAYIAQRR